MRAARRLLLLAAGVAFLPGRAEAQTYLIVATGLSGEPAYATAFREWSTTLLGAARHVLNIPAANETWLAERADSADGLVAQRSTRENLAHAIAAVAAKAEPTATVCIVLIGHGTDGATPAESRFDLPGPDITAAEMARQLGAFTTQRVIVVNAASASADWISVLAASGRVIITATRGTEGYATQFPRFFAAAFADSTADTDKDGRLTALEAFTFARKNVAQLYESQHTLATEHAQISDSTLAASMFLDMPRAVAAGSTVADSALARLYARRDSLTRALADLRALKAGMDSTAYGREEERLLLEIARNGGEIRARGGH